jgi:hypothetical protein
MVRAAVLRKLVDQNDGEDEEIDDAEDGDTRDLMRLLALRGVAKRRRWQRAAFARLLREAA